MINSYCIYLKNINNESYICVMIELIEMRDKIEKITKKQQIEILKIIKKMDVPFSENNNGVFFNLSLLNHEQLNKLNSYINYLKDQDESLQTIEDMKNELSDVYFNGIKNTVKDNNSKYTNNEFIT